MLTAKSLKEKENIINRKILIIKSGRTQRRVAEIVGISRISLYKTLCGINKNPETQKKIARAVNVPKEIFWPEFFGNGNGNNKSSHGSTVTRKAKSVN